MSVNINFEPIFSDVEATLVATAIKGNYFGENDDFGARDAANGALEAYFVTTLRAATKEGLGARLEELKAQFGTMNAFKRATERVKAFRGKNSAWKTFTV